MTLEQGKEYDTDALTHIGWTAGDGSGHEGYHYLDYFKAMSTTPGPLGLPVADSGHAIYLGPDEHGIEPTFL